MAGGILDQARKRLPIQYQGWESRTDDYGNRVAPGGIRNYRMPSFGAPATAGGGTPEQTCIAQGGTWDPINKVCRLPDGSAVTQDPTSGDLTGVDAYGNPIVIHTSGEGPFADPAGTHTPTEGLGTLSHDELNNPGDNYTNIPGLGEAFTTTHTGVDSSGNPFSQPVVVTDSSNAGDLSTAASWNVGSEDNYGHLNNISHSDYIKKQIDNLQNEISGAFGDEGIIASIVDASPLGKFLSGGELEIITSGLGKVADFLDPDGIVQYELSSTNQLGQNVSASHPGGWVKKPDGTYVYVDETAGQPTPNVPEFEGTLGETSTDAKALLKKREGFSETAYKDTEGNWTIGYGSITMPDGSPVKPGDTITEDQAEVQLNNNVAIAEQAAKSNIDNFENLSPELQTALISQAYQLGEGGQAGFTNMVDAINKGNWDAAIEEARNSKWAGQTPTRVEDLVGAILVEAAKSSGSASSGTSFTPSTDGKSAATIAAEKAAVANAWEDTAGVPSGGGSDDNDDWRDEHNKRHEENVKKAAEEAIEKGEAPVGSTGGPSPHINRGGYVRKNYGGILSKANGGLNHGNPQTHPGKPMGTDRVPLWGEEGEFVMTREGTAKMEQDHPGLLQKYNDYRPPVGTIEGTMSQIDDLINKYAQRRG